MARTDRKGADPLDWRARYERERPRGSSLEVPAPKKGETPVYPTAYVTDRLLVSTLGDLERARDLLGEAAREHGWRLEVDETFRELRLEPRPGELEDRRRRHPWATGPLGLVRFVIVAERGAQTPDAWVVLQDARARATEQGLELRGVGLDHIMTIDGGFTSSPYHSTPYHSTPYHSTPYHSTAGFDPSSGATPMDAYLFQGSGGRQPIAVVLPQPVRVEQENPVIVGTLDTGMGGHPWLAGLAPAAVGLPAIGRVDDSDDPELHPDLVGPLDGMTDVLSGHGTFIAGLIHQTAPDADIMPWRVVGPDGTIDESEVSAALAAIVDIVERAVDAPGSNGSLPLDVLSLSMGYYHETPEDYLIDVTLAELLLRLRRAGTVVVCSAGNDGTSRPMFPAAFGPWDSTPDSDVPWVDQSDAAPLISVGARNPNGSTALFSNTGAWVQCYAEGASVVSTAPASPGGSQPIARTIAYSRTRETIDPDDYSSGFAVWSGTSFAAPVIAGRVAAAIGLAGGTPTSAEDRVKRAISAAAGVVADAT
ncbi:MAG: hypothetical protein JWN36_3033 [Microbacteriaceae bacterium]|nr:hypothetical protein [Microbacteriaceae bacterium]